MFNKLIAFGKNLINNKNNQSPAQEELLNKEELVQEEIVNNFNAEEFLEILKKEITKNIKKRVEVLNFKEDSENPLYKISFVHNFSTVNLCEISSENVSLFNGTTLPLTLNTVYLLVQKCQTEQLRIDEFKASKKSKAAQRFELANQQTPKRL